MTHTDLAAVQTAHHLARQMILAARLRQPRRIAPAETRRLVMQQARELARLLNQVLSAENKRQKRRAKRLEGGRK